MESQPVAKDTNNSTVQVICPTCHTAKDIHIDTLWKRHDKHRFTNINCTSCKTTKRIGDCIRRHNSQFITVKAWLQTNSFNGISFLNHVARPPTASVELFRGITESTTNMTESDSSKRRSQDVTDDNAKRRRRDETQPQ